jgi:hypothetical protein
MHYHVWAKNDENETDNGKEKEGKEKGKSVGV